MASADKVLFETALEGFEAKNLSKVLKSEDINSVLEQAYIQSQVKKEKEDKLKIVALIAQARRT